LYFCKIVSYLSQENFSSANKVLLQNSLTYSLGFKEYRATWPFVIPFFQSSNNGTCEFGLCVILLKPKLESVKVLVPAIPCPIFPLLCSAIYIIFVFVVIITLLVFIMLFCQNIMVPLLLSIQFP
jgi:hypothetical protein